MSELSQGKDAKRKNTFADKIFKLLPGSEYNLCTTMRTKETMTYENHKISPQGISVPLLTKRMWIDMATEADLGKEEKINLLRSRDGEPQRPSQRLDGKIEYPYYMISGLAGDMHAASFNRILSVLLNTRGDHIFLALSTDKILNVMCNGARVVINVQSV